MKNNIYFKTVIMLILIITMIAIVVLLKNNEEHFAKKRFCTVDKIVVRWVYDGQGDYSDEGIEVVTISEPEEVKKWKNMLYDIDTEGHWFTSGDGPQWDCFFEVDVCYTDGYEETINVLYKTRAYKRINIDVSYSIGDSEELYCWCYDLFFDEPNPNLPEK